MTVQMQRAYEPLKISLVVKIDSFPLSSYHKSNRFSNYQRATTFHDEAKTHLQQRVKMRMCKAQEGLHSNDFDKQKLKGKYVLGFQAC